jgi:hypothetical protein
MAAIKIPGSKSDLITIHIAEPGRSNHEWRNQGAFAALTESGSIIAWGRSYDGGDGPPSLQGKFIDLFANRHSFAGLRADGSLVTWGAGSKGGNSSQVASALSSGVERVFSTRRAYAALKRDGSVVTWGEAEEGGDSSQVAVDLKGGVKEIFTSSTSMAALKRDGSVVTVTWGLATTDARSEELGGVLVLTRLRLGRVTLAVAVAVDDEEEEIDHRVVADDSGHEVGVELAPHQGQDFRMHLLGL